MPRILTGLLMFLLAPSLQAGEAKIVGNWKVFAIEQGRPTFLYLMRVTETDKKISGQLIPMKGYPDGFIESIKVEGDLVKIKMRLERVQLTFEGKLPTGAAKNINGSLEQFSGVFPAYLEPTKAKSTFDLGRELVEKTPNDPSVGVTVLELLEKASAEKVAVKDVQDWVELALRTSATHGPRWHTELSIRLLNAMTKNDYADLAAAMSKKMEAELDPKAPGTSRIAFMESMVAALKKVKKTDEANKVESQIDVLENNLYTDYVKSSKDVPVKKFVGRKADSKRAVLVELFTGAQCPPCVAADLAFDALEKTYQPTDVVLLQYHLHIPGPDALTNADTEARAEYYKEAVRGTPCILFNGKVEAPKGGGKAEAKGKYEEYCGVVDQLLEKTTPVSITVKAVRKENKIHITAKVSNTGKPGDKVRLRLALVEDWVRYRGSNGMTYHHRVVRAMPGGFKGVPLPNMTGDVNTTVNLDTLRRDTIEFLEDFVRKEETRFPTDERPLRFRHLHVVAFVQDDASNEVLQAVDVPVKSE